MKRRLIILTIVIGCYIPAFTQISIEECQNKARINYPLIKQYGLIDKTKEYNLSNAGKGYLPQLSVSAKATYQSQVTEIPIDVPGVEGMSKDQYIATIDLNQTIWDGGVISGKKNVTKTSAYAEQKQLEVDLYTINERVNQLYFGILLLDAKLRQNELYQEELQRNYKLISNYIHNGVANQADLDVVKVEQLKTIQNATQLTSDRKAYLNMLASFIGERLEEGTVLQKPDTYKLLVSPQINRPELELFDAQHNNIEAQKHLIKTNYMPKLGLFVTGGYGKPGLNMLENKFSAYYIGGVKLSWNFGSLYTQKDEKRIIETSQQTLATQRETFLFNTNLQIIQDQNEINRNYDLLKYDDEIITLRNNVKRAAEAKVANGTLTVTDLMKEITSEDLARQDKIEHEIQLLQSVYKLKYTTNN